MASFSTDKDDTIRYLSKNASFHISRISSFLWRGGDTWTNTGNLKTEIATYIANKGVLDGHISNAIFILSNIVKSNPKYISDLNNTLKSADIDNEISKELYSNHKPKPATV